MKRYHSIEEYDAARRAGQISGGSAVTLGKFDGVHLGHQKLLQKVMEKSRTELSSVVFAIEISSSGILSHEERALFLEQLGIDVLIECPFTKQISGMSAEDFVSRILRDILNAAYVAVGTDYHFGRKRLGDSNMLTALAPENGFEAEIVEKERYLDLEISSSRVRDSLKAGDMELTNHLLGRNYPILGTILHGRHIGTSLGMPTVNLIPPQEKLLPPDGVYASFSYLPDGRIFRGITNIGLKPTVGADFRGVETNLMDFDEDLYGTRIRTDLVHFLRPERKFDSLNALREQVGRDKEAALSYLI